MHNIYDNSTFFKEYANMPRSQQGLEAAGEWHQLQALFPDLHGKRVLDLGCGYGWHCQYAISCGASSVLGLDLSENMIQTAKEKHPDERITYQVCDLDTYAYPPNQFDCVISNLVLHYVDDLSAVYARIYQTLTDNGYFLLNIEHPIFTAGRNQDWIYDSQGAPNYWPVDQYFYPGERKTHFLGQDVLKQHHTLTQIVNGLLLAGFSLEALEEAMPPAHMLDLPGMKDELKRPMMLLLKAKKTPR